MSKYIHVTEFTTGMICDATKRKPSSRRHQFSSLINIDDIIKVEDFEKSSEDDNENSCCKIYLDKRKFGDNNIITVLEKYSYLCSLIIKTNKMSYRYVEDRGYRNDSESSTISVPVYCGETVGCGGYLGHERWVNGNCCGRGYYERGSC